MKEKFNLNKRILIGLFLLIIMFIFYSIGYVNTEWTESSESYIVEDVNADIKGVTTAQNQHIFFCSDNNRWYIMYVFCDGGTTNYRFSYSYSGSGDFTEWNNGGLLMIDHVYKGQAEARAIVGAQGAWTYDNENEIGHLVYTDLDPTELGLYYRNFTMQENGALTLGSTRTLYYKDGDFRGYVDISLSHNNLPMIAMGGYNGVVYTYGLMCESINGYSDNWICVSAIPLAYATTMIASVPTGDNSMIIFSACATVNFPLDMFSITFGVTINDTVSTTVFSDLNLISEQVYSSSEYMTAYGVSYNSTHGCVSYTDSTFFVSNSFTFDFFTLTRSDEYESIDINSETTLDVNYVAGVTIQNNEFFTATYTVFGIAYEQIWINEYHVPLYDSYFNVSAQNNATDELAHIGGAHFDIGSVSRMTDNNGNALFMYGYDDDVMVTYITYEGEYSDNGNGNGDEEEDEEFDFWFFKWILALIVFITIVSFAIYVKGGKR